MNQDFVVTVQGDGVKERVEITNHFYNRDYVKLFSFFLTYKQTTFENKCSC